MVFSNIAFGAGLIGTFFMLLMMGIGIAIFVFWIVMLVDCVKRKFKNDTDKIVWVLVIIFAGIIGALIYYFIVKSKGKR